MRVTPLPATATIRRGFFPLEGSLEVNRRGVPEFVPPSL